MIGRDKEELLDGLITCVNGLIKFLQRRKRKGIGSILIFGNNGTQCALF